MSGYFFGQVDVRVIERFSFRSVGDGMENAAYGAEVGSSQKEITGPNGVEQPTVGHVACSFQDLLIVGEEAVWYTRVRGLGILSRSSDGSGA